MKLKKGRYSGYIRPFSYIIDLLIINVLSLYIIPSTKNEILHHVYISFIWFSVATNIGFYEVYRYTKVITILNQAFKQAILFSFLCFSGEFYFSEISNFRKVVLFTLISLFIIVSIKLFIYYFLRKYRVLFGQNFRKVVLIGNDKNIAPLKNFFIQNPDYGYQLIKVFPILNNKKKQIKDFLIFISNNKIDEIYCSMADLSETYINKIVDFADNNLKTLKFIPNPKKILSLNVKYDYYDYIPVISSRNITQDESLNKIFKRIFDIVFSLIVIVGVLSWLIPILALLIKLDSKGPLFFVQKRNGLNYKEFNCYKFRSLEINNEEEFRLVSKNDQRITRIGKFIRKTSIDELPQFFNVLMGDMSVVGPRPHPVIVANEYAARVDKFMVRHFIKPGITGLAQTMGYRGEVENEEDIINRVKYDIFYIENWSILLDIKIIFNTILNIIKGDKKAY